MKYRELGRTGLQVSEIGFGCAHTGGLLTHGEQRDRLAGVARALELGINHFDTAPNYANGVSEQHLGEALRELGARPIIASKVEIWPGDFADIPGRITHSAEGSLQRLGVDTIDILYLHNRVASRRSLQNSSIGSNLSVDDVLGSGGVLEIFDRLRRSGKVRYLGFCVGSEIAVSRHVMASEGFHCVQLSYNILNPTEGRLPPPGFDGPDRGQCIDTAAARGIGVVVITPLARGVLSGHDELHPLSHPGGGPSATPSDRERARSLRAILQRENQTMAQGALRFALAKPEVSSVLVGFSEMAHIEEAAACSDLGGLCTEELARLDRWYEETFAETV